MGNRMNCTCNHSAAWPLTQGCPLHDEGECEHGIYGDSCDVCFETIPQRRLRRATI